MPKVRIPDDVLEFFRKAGSVGGKRRAAKHTKAQLREWGRLGGRPPSDKKKGGKGSRYSYQSPTSGTKKGTNESQSEKNAMVCIIARNVAPGGFPTPMPQESVS